MRKVDTLIESRWILPIIPKGTVLHHHAIAVENGRIIDVLPAAEAQARYEAIERVELPNSIVMPGFVNLHAHAAMNLVRGLGADLPLMDWLTQKIWPAEGKLMSPDFVREGSYLAGLEMAAGGITTASDHYFFPEDAASGLREAGLRCAVAGIVIGFPSAWAKSDEEYLEKAEAFIEAHRNDAWVRPTIGPHAPYTVSDHSLEKCAEISDRFDVPIHMHVNETAVEVSESLRDHGMRPIERLKRLGLLNSKLVAVHSVHANASDIAAMAEAGASMCHCPCSNLKLASGFAPIAEFFKAGVNVGIGTDGAASNDKLDMLGETRLAAMLAKAVASDTTAAPVHDMLEAATLGGARALHWDDEIGSIEAGKFADVIALDLSGVECLPVQDPAAQLLYAADRTCVTHTWTAGRLIYSRGDSPAIASQREKALKIASKWQNRI